MKICIGNWDNEGEEVGGKNLFILRATTQAQLATVLTVHLQTEWSVWARN
jgi:hypothetical protein